MQSNRYEQADSRTDNVRLGMLDTARVRWVDGMSDRQVGRQ